MWPAGCIKEFDWKTRNLDRAFRSAKTRMRKVKAVANRGRPQWRSPGPERYGAASRRRLGRSRWLDSCLSGAGSSYKQLRTHPRLALAVACLVAVLLYLWGARNISSQAMYDARDVSDFIPNWRPDLQCGRGWKAPDQSASSTCDPFSKNFCCSQWCVWATLLSSLSSRDLRRHHLFL